MVIVMMNRMKKNRIEKNLDTLKSEGDCGGANEVKR